MIFLCGLDIARVRLIIAVCDVAFSTGLPPGKLKGYNKYRMLGWLSRLRCHFPPKKNKMKPTNPNAHTYVNGTDVKTHGFAVTHNTFLQ